MIAAVAALLLSVGATQSAPRPPCTGEAAERLSFEQVMAGSERLLGQCVTIEVLAWGLSLYRDREGEYLAARTGLSRNPHRLGYYPFDDGSSPDALPRGRYVLTGIVMTCRALQDLLLARNTEPDLLPLAGGYCHRFGGAVIMPVARDPAPHEPELRFVGDEMRDRFGNLEPAPADWPALPRLRLAAEAFRAALAAGDGEKLRRLHGFHAAGADRETDLFVARMVSDPASPFADLRRSGVESEPAIFIESGPIRRSDIANDEEPAAWLCFCRTGDCGGLWPISSIDTAARDGRPYVCTYYRQNREDQGLSGTLTTWDEPDGSAERPESSAFRRQSESSRR